MTFTNNHYPFHIITEATITTISPSAAIITTTSTIGNITTGTNAGTISAVLLPPLSLLLQLLLIFLPILLMSSVFDILRTNTQIVYCFCYMCWAFWGPYPKSHCCPHGPRLL